MIGMVEATAHHIGRRKSDSSPKIKKTNQKIFRCIEKIVRKIPIRPPVGKRRALGYDDLVPGDSQRVVKEGQHTFRFDMFGDEAWWGDTLHLHEAIEGAKLGGSKSARLRAKWSA